MIDYVIGGMDRSFKLKLFHTLRAAELAGLSPGITSAFRDDYRQSIGSGQIEGACKNLIGRRLKQTGARWRPRRVNRMAGLCTVMYTDHWKTYWNTLLA